MCDKGILPTITFVIYDLSAGGAQRVMSMMANYWAAKGWTITIITFDDGSTPPFYDLLPGIRHMPLDVAEESSFAIKGILNNLDRVRVLSRAIRSSNPDAVISFMNTVNVLTLMATRILGIPVLVSERTDPAMHNIGRVWERLRLLFYPYSVCIIVQTDRARDYFPVEMRKSVAIIPNPVNILPYNEVILPVRGKDKPCPSQMIVAMGRFEEEKGFDLLLQAFARVHCVHLDWTLTILGDGPLRSKLEALCEKSGLSGSVSLPGNVRNPHTYLINADIFVLSSRFEGFPNAILDAMVCGLPVIATDCRSGPREILRDGVDGILVQPDDVDALAAAMERLISSEAERAELGARAVEVRERFGMDAIMGQWEKILEKACPR